MGGPGPRAGVLGDRQWPSAPLIRARTWAIQHAGHWALLGGARDSHESAAGAALREAAEECAVPPGAARIDGLLDDDHGGWSWIRPCWLRTRRSASGLRVQERPRAAWVPWIRSGSLPSASWGSR